MQIKAMVIISKAEQSTKYPDTCYFDMVDLETGQPVQAATKKMSFVEFLPHLLIPVRIEGKMTLRPARSGGTNVQFEDIQIQGSRTAEPAPAKG